MRKRNTHREKERHLLLLKHWLELTTFQLAAATKNTIASKRKREREKEREGERERERESQACVRCV